MNLYSDIHSEIVWMFSGILASKSKEIIDYIMDKKFNVINYFHEVLQNFEDGNIINSMIFCIANLASEAEYKNLIYKTNFFSRLKIVSKNEHLSLKYKKDIVWALYNFSKSTLPYTELTIWIEILSEFIHGILKV